MSEAINFDPWMLANWVRRKTMVKVLLEKRGKSKNGSLSLSGELLLNEVNCRFGFVHFFLNSFIVVPFA